MLDIIINEIMRECARLNPAGFGFLSHPRGTTSLLAYSTIKFIPLVDVTENVDYVIR